MLSRSMRSRLRRIPHRCRLHGTASHRPLSKMKTPHLLPVFRRALARWFSALLVVHVACVQTATPSAADRGAEKKTWPTPTTVAKAAGDEAVELSPFLVKPDSGWIATETLSGTRLRTELRDVPSE